MMLVSLWAVMVFNKATTQKVERSPHTR